MVRSKPRARRETFTYKLRTDLVCMRRCPDEHARSGIEKQDKSLRYLNDKVYGKASALERETTSRSNGQNTASKTKAIAPQTFQTFPPAVRRCTDRFLCGAFDVLTRVPLHSLDPRPLQNPCPTLAINQHLSEPGAKVSLTCSLIDLSKYSPCAGICPSIIKVH